MTGLLYNKFNQAYFVGGPEQAMAALNRNMDLNITDYITFNWKAVADAINILGGVDIELSKAEFYYINSFITETVKATGIGSNQLTHAGMNHLDGVQAVAYGRLRLMDTDFARTERQRKVIKLAFEKAKTADFETLNRVLGTVFPEISTSLWVDDIYVQGIDIPPHRYGCCQVTFFTDQAGDPVALPADHQAHRPGQVLSVHHRPLHVGAHKPDALLFQVLDGTRQVRDPGHRHVVDRPCGCTGNPGCQPHGPMFGDDHPVGACLVGCPDDRAQVKRLLIVKRL